jgi:Aldehyde dehydrogenase family
MADRVPAQVINCLARPSKGFGRLRDIVGPKVYGKVTMSTWQMMIGGKSVPSTDTFDVFNPFDESLVGRCAEATDAHVEDAVRAAKAALPAWSAQRDGTRAERLMDIASLIEKHHEELSSLVTREQGKPQSGPGANFEVGGAAVWTRATAALSLPEEIIQEDASAKITVARKPVGVVAFDYSLELAVADRHVAPDASGPRWMYRRDQAFAVHAAIDTSTRRIDESGAAARRREHCDRQRRRWCAPG